MQLQTFLQLDVILYFSCYRQDGFWHVGLDSSKDPLAVKGAFALGSLINNLVWGFGPT